MSAPVFIFGYPVDGHGCDPRSLERLVLRGLREGVRLVADDAGLVTIWNDSGAYISLWRTVFERRAPESIEPVETLLSTRIGTGNVVRDLRDEVLNALTLAYREAAAQASR